MNREFVSRQFTVYGEAKDFATKVSGFIEGPFHGSDMSTEYIVFYFADKEYQR